MSTVDRSIASLRAHPLFAAAPAGALQGIEGTAVARQLQAGDWLFREGDPPESLFLVDSGRLRVVAGDTTLRIVGPGDIQF